MWSNTMELRLRVLLELLRRNTLGITGVVAIGVIASGCGGGEGSVPGEAADQPNVRVVNVEVTPVVLDDFTGYIRVTGEVEAMHDVTMSAEETGRIERFFAEKGDRVRRGESIAKLEDDLLAAQVDEARASAQLAREEYERQRQLWEQDSIGTEILYLQRRYAAEIAAARLSMLESRLARTEIRAPVAGTLDERFLEQGEMAAAGAPVARVVATDSVKIAAGVPERYARSVQPGDEARVTFDILPDQEFVGRVNFVGASVDPQSRTFPIEIVLDNPDDIMKPAMVANLRVERERLNDVIAVPQHAVLRSADGYKVFVAEQQGDGYVAHARTVSLGPVSGNTVVIEDGIAVGDLLVTVGQQLVDDESRVRIVNRLGMDRTEGAD